jgi:hypothetical protein
MGQRTCVVHLLRATNATDAAERFFASYRRFPAGAPHDVLLVCKGFVGGALPRTILDAVGGVAHKTIFIPDEGFDITAYHAAARATDASHLALFNSFSEILADQWLEKLVAAVEDNTGAAGATGSFESAWTNTVAAIREKPLRLLSPRGGIAALVRTRRRFPPFPNVHLRSNALVIARERFLALSGTHIRSKIDAEALESGRDSLSLRLRAMSLALRVVDRDGALWREEGWPKSRTFRSGAQEGLLVADNRTREYAAAGEQRRAALARMAWGGAA